MEEKKRILQSNHTWGEMCEHYIKSIKREGGLNKPGIEEKFRKWFMSKEYLGNIPFDYRMVNYCYMVQGQLKKDRDWITAITGGEGEGKTTFAVNYCAWISPTFTLDNVCFGYNSFLLNLKDSKPGDSIQADEGANFLFSREAMNSDTRDSIKVFTQVRYKRNHIAVLIPNFHILDSYLREHRVKSLIHIISRGNYKAIINQLAIKRVSDLGRKTKQVAKVRLTSGTFFHGCFLKSFPSTILAEDYEKRKSKYVISAIDKALEKVEVRDNPKWVRISEAAKTHGLTKYMVEAMAKKDEITMKRVAGHKYVNSEEMAEKFK